LQSLAALNRAGLIDPERMRALKGVAARYAVAVTPAMAALIDSADPLDPIGRQFLPTEAELQTGVGESVDPIGDALHTPVEGVVHRYPDRVLLMVTHVCAVYCRFCFRRETVGDGSVGALSAETLETALAYIAEDSNIWEVILTGGDPLVLSPRRLDEILSGLDRIDHVKVVRIHTRVPAVAPERVTAALTRTLRRPGKAVFVALHANHPREMTPEARAACARLVDAGIPMVSQTVLLKGVNDDPDVLGALMRAFVEARVKPYYLHQGDFAPGTGHMRTRVVDGQTLMRRLRGRYSGLCQPTFVLDVPGGHGKVPVGPSYLNAKGETLEVEDPFGGSWSYPPGERET
jgi:lysine 2,3-aminomutase